MNKEECVLLGKITKTFGLKGDVEIRLIQDIHELPANIHSLFLEIDGALVPFLLTEYTIHRNNYRLHFEDIKSIDEAEKFINVFVYILKKDLPAKTIKERDISNVIDFIVIDSHHGELGKITEVIEHPGQKIFQLFKNKKEILIPAVESIINKIDWDTKTIYLTAPEGLIELYLG